MPSQHHTAGANDELDATRDPSIQRVRLALSTARTVAIVRLGSIGDVIATLPVAWLLRDLLPAGARIVWIAHPGPAAILRGVRAIDEVIALRRPPLLHVLPAWRAILRPAAIDVVFDLHGNIKSAVATFLTGAALRVGFAPGDSRERLGALATNAKLPRLSSGNKTRRALEIARILGHPRPELRFGLEFSEAEMQRAAAVMGTSGLPTTVLQLGRAGDVRAWPASHCAELALRLAEQGRRTIVIGGPDEVETGTQVARLLGDDVPPEVQLEVATLSLREVGALCATLEAQRHLPHCFVGPDSGCLHLAAACGLRSFGLFGPQDPVRTAPVTPCFEAIRHPEAARCIPCSQRECAHVRPVLCMESIRPEEVVASIAALATGAQGPPQGPPAPTVDRGGATASSRPPSEPARRTYSRILPSAQALPAPVAAGAGPWVATDVALLLAVAFLVLLLNALRGGPWSGREAIEAEVARATWPLGTDWTPRIGGEPTGALPSLRHVIVATSLRVLGHGAVPARLPSMLAGVGTVAAAYFIARRLGGHRAGIVSGLLLAAAWGLARDGSTVGAPALGALWVGWSLAFYLEGTRHGTVLEHVGAPLSALCAVLAFAISGPWGLALPALAIVLHAIAARSPGSLLRPTVLVSAAGALVLAAAWVVASHGSDPARTLIDAAIDPRRIFPEIVGDPPVSIRPAALLGALALAAAPVTLLVPFAAYNHVKIRRYREDLGLADARWRLPKLALVASAILVVPLDRSVRDIVLPVVALGCVLTGAWMEGCLWRRPAARLTARALPLAAAAMLLLAAFAPPRIFRDPGAADNREAVEVVKASARGGAALLGIDLSPSAQAILAFHMDRTFPSLREAAGLETAAELRSAHPVVIVAPVSCLAEVQEVLAARATSTTMNTYEVMGRIVLDGREMRIVHWANR